VVLQDGDVSIKDIDQDMVAFGMPVGPFTLLDTVGLDIALEVARILHRSYGPRMAPAPLLEALVKAGRTGVKAGHGFYEYGNEDERAGTQRLEDLVQQLRQLSGSHRRDWTRARPLLAMVNEAVIALQEGVASARDIDLAVVAGTGFPNDKGGPLHLADQLGIDQVFGSWRSSRRAWESGSGPRRCCDEWWMPVLPAGRPGGAFSNTDAPVPDRRPTQSDERVQCLLSIYEQVIQPLHDARFL
jgi:3-hydroxyacyl-CoA dehydrogenase